MFSKKTEYALRTTIYVAQKSSEEKKVSISEIAEGIDSPKAFVAKIIQSLTKKGRIISSVSGPHGGFYMTEKAKKLPIYSILRATGEADELNKCILGLDECSNLKPCPLHSRYKFIKEQMLELFKNETIDKLAYDINRGGLFISNKERNESIKKM